MTVRVDRRTVLRGLGTAVALPWLEAMSPSTALAASTAAPPVRSAFMFVPNGVHLPAWTPQREGYNYDLPSILEPLRNVKDDMVVLSGLTQDKARHNSDGAGDHARAASVYLTGVQPVKAEGSIRVGVSVDQVMAEKIGQYTRFPSLELGCDRSRNAGQCDSGYSCAYSSNISWRSATTPNAKEVDPRQAFERLFGNEDPQQARSARDRRAFYRESVLDFVRDDARTLNKRLGQTDRRKLEEYYTGIRELEKRLENADKVVDELPAGFVKPTGIPSNYEDHIRAMADVLILAFQTDMTRIATFMIASAGSNRSYPQVGVGDGHHELSHHRNDSSKQDKLRRINRWHTTQLAYMLQKMKSIREGEGTLLDNCMVVYGSGISDGNRHNNEDLPLLLAGRGGGAIATGRHIKYPSEVPMCNLFLSMMDRMNASAGRFGDSTGRLRGLEG